MSQKLVSIIIPTYNRADMVADAIESALCQSYRPIQIIVADDGSTDDTADKVAKFDGVEYYRQEHKGHAAARNLGLSHANGEYIASLDSDDIWDKDFLKVAVEGVERFDADFVFLNWREVCDGIFRPSGWEGDKELHRHVGGGNSDWTPLNADSVRSLYLHTCPSPSSALLIRRSSIVSRWNEKMKIADDWYLILEMVLMQKCRAAFNRSPYWSKTVHTTNIYHGRDEFEVVRDLGLHDRTLIAHDFRKRLTFQERRVLNKQLSKHYFNYGRLNFRREGFAKGFESIAISFTLSPMSGIFSMLQLSFNHLKNRFRIARSNRRVVSEDLAASKHS